MSLVSDIQNLSHAQLLAAYKGPFSNDNLLLMKAMAELHAAGPRAWALGTNYSAGDFVVRNNGIFVAKLSHTSTSIFEPGVPGLEGDWTPYWTCVAWYDLDAESLKFEGTVEGTLLKAQSLISELSQLDRVSILRSMFMGQVGMDLHWVNGGGYSTGVISAGTAPTYTPQGRSFDIYMAATTLGNYCVNLDGNGTASQKQLFLPGSIGTVTASSITVDWSKSWMMRFVMVNYLGAASGAQMTVQVGVDSSLRSHTLNTKSVGFRITEGASAATIAAIAHNGTSESVTNAGAASDVARTFNDKVWELVYLAGTGLYLYCDGILQATIAPANLPSGNGVAGAHTLQICFLSGGASSAGIRIRIEQIQFFRL